MKNLLLIFTILLVGCNNYLDKSVFEPLTQEELNEGIKKDSSFSLFYEQITTLNESYKDDSIRSKYKGITYRMAYKLFCYTDTALYNKSINDWNKKYGNYQILVDSISNYWKEKKEKYNLDQYAKIELAKVETEHYSFGGISDVSLGFKLTPLKGKVDQIIFVFSIKPKIKDNYDYDKSRATLTQPFSKPTIKYWKANYNMKNELGNKTLESILRDYDILIEIEKIRFNGENISKIDIPFEIENYWEYDFYKERIIKKYIDKSYIEDYKYINNQFASKLREIDPLTAEYLHIDE